MKRILLILSVFLCLFLMSCEQDSMDSMSDNQSFISEIDINKKSQISLQQSKIQLDDLNLMACGESEVYTLYAGQTIVVGKVTVSNDEENVYVVYTTEGDWWMKENGTHLFVGPESDLPLNGGGNPKIGHFPYHGVHGTVQSYTFEVPIGEWGDCFVISAHAEVVRLNESRQVEQSETAFGCGDKSNEFDGSRWGCFNDYCLKKCKDAFGFKFLNPEHSDCQSYVDGEEALLWINEFNYYWLQNRNYQFTLLADSEDCVPQAKNGDVTDADAIVVGYIDITMYSDNGNRYTDIDYVITNSDYKLSKVNLYLSTVSSPSDLNPYNGDYNYDGMSSEWDETSTKFVKLPWPGAYNAWDTFIIPHAQVEYVAP